MHYVISYSDAELRTFLCDVRAQNAALQARSEYAHRISMQDGGGLDRSSTQGGRGTQPCCTFKSRTLNAGRSYSSITKRYSLSSTSRHRLFMHNLIGIGGPRQRRVGQSDTDTHDALETVPPVLPPPIAKTKSSSSAKSRKRKELVVEREDGFIRGEAVPCRCTQVTQITSALHPLIIFIL